MDLTGREYDTSDVDTADPGRTDMETRGNKEVEEHVSDEWNTEELMQVIRQIDMTISYFRRKLSVVWYILHMQW